MSYSRPLWVGATGLGLVYAASNCLFNVESGKRGIVYNRIGGIKEEVSPEAMPTTCPLSGFGSWRTTLLLTF
jgi:hypothetical protein